MCACHAHSYYGMYSSRTRTVQVHKTLTIKIQLELCYLGFERKKMKEMGTFKQFRIYRVVIFFIIFWMSWAKSTGFIATELYWIYGSSCCKPVRCARVPNYRYGVQNYGAAQRECGRALPSYLVPAAQPGRGTVTSAWSRVHMQATSRNASAAPRALFCFHAVFSDNPFALLRYYAENYKNRKSSWVMIGLEIQQC